MMVENRSVVLLSASAGPGEALLSASLTGFTNQQQRPPQNWENGGPLLFFTFALFRSRQQPSVPSA